MTKLMARLMWPSMIAAVTVASPAFAQAADEGFVDADEQQQDAAGDAQRRLRHAERR